MTTRSWLAVCLIAASLLASTAWAQCPGGLTDPLFLINGTSWAFLTQDGAMGDATVGVFTAQAVPNPRTPTSLSGVLKITETFNNRGVIQTQLTVAGAYQIYPDCSGGTLLMHTTNNSYQYSFVFAMNRTKMLLLSPGSVTRNYAVTLNSIGDEYVRTSDSYVPNDGYSMMSVGNRGKAVVLATAPSCVGVVNPLTLLAGNWSFQTQNSGSASIGLFSATVQPSSRTPSVTIGALNFTQTVFGVPGTPTRLLMPGEGIYTVDSSDCSGGTLSFNSGGNALVYWFVFAGPTQIFMVSTAATDAGALFRADHGQAEKF